jgi:heat shock factor-binding protein 1
MDSPFLRSQEAMYGRTSSFSLGPALNESGPQEVSPATDPSQSTADLTAFVQNLLQQMQLRFQSMSDAILVRIDEMATRIEDLEKTVDDVLREVTGTDDHFVLPSPSSSPIRRAAVAPQSPDVRKLSLGGSGQFVPVSPILGGRYPSGSGALSKKSTSVSQNVPSSPDFRRHSTSGTYVPSSPGTRRQF